MRIKMKVLYDSWLSLIAISAVDLPVLFSFDLKEILKSKEGTVRNVEQIRVALIKKHGIENTKTVEKDGEKTEVPTGDFSFSPEAKNLFDKEISVVFDKTIPLDITPIKISTLDPKVNIKPGVLLVLDWLFIK